MKEEKEKENYSEDINDLKALNVRSKDEIDEILDCDQFARTSELTQKDAGCQLDTNLGTVAGTIFTGVTIVKT